MIDEVRTRAGEAERLGLSETGLAILGLIRPQGDRVAEPDRARIELAALLEEGLAGEVEIVDRQHKDDVQREMRRKLKRQLRAGHYAEAKLDPLANQIVDLLKARRTS